MKRCRAGFWGAHDEKVRKGHLRRVHGTQMQRLSARTQRIQRGGCTGDPPALRNLLVHGVGRPDRATWERRRAGSGEEGQHLLLATSATDRVELKPSRKGLARHDRQPRDEDGSGETGNTDRCG